LNTEWKWLVETSAEWAAFRLAKYDSKGLVRRGTSLGFARRHATEEYINALSLLTTPRKLSMPMSHHPLIAPFTDISDPWLVMLKSALENARDDTKQTANLGDAYMYIPPELGSIMSHDRVAVGERLQMRYLGM
jgi:hypothetical protein